MSTDLGIQDRLASKWHHTFSHESPYWSSAPHFGQCQLCIGLEKHLFFFIEKLLNYFFSIRSDFFKLSKILDDRSSFSFECVV